MLEEDEVAVEEEKKEKGMKEEGECGCSEEDGSRELRMKLRKYTYRGNKRRKRERQKRGRQRNGVKSKGKRSTGRERREGKSG
jgi:hypothetical protein